ncbi:ROK family protein [Agrobacterium vitis]|nr:ROK family protein [Agrobacterium vitis]
MYAFDIGGTWFRSALVMPEGDLVYDSRCPAINYISNPERSPEELQEALVEWLVSETDRISETEVNKSEVVAISLGAAVDHRTGEVLGSGPLWGPRARPFNLVQRLRNRKPQFRWNIINDVTAHLLDAISQLPSNPLDRYGKVMLITVSTGIGARTVQLYDLRVPVDPVCGLQGEIGHLPVTVMFGNRTWHRQCECGGKDHLNAFASGRGIDGLLADIRFTDPSLLAGSILGYENAGVSVLASAVSDLDPVACSFLDAVTRPLADILRTTFTVDPDLRHLFLTGGVVHGLGQAYLRSLGTNFAMAGLYQVTDREPAFLDQRLSLIETDNGAGIRGAALAATLSKVSTSLWQGMEASDA